MNVTSLELSKRLHRLSKWDDTYLRWANFKEPRVVNADEWASNAKNKAIIDTIELLPAYDLGYMLRKLVEHGIFPKVRYVDADFHTSMDLKEWHGKWVASLIHLKQGEYPYADTPEDALAMLIIQSLEEDKSEKGADDLDDVLKQIDEIIPKCNEVDCRTCDERHENVAKLIIARDSKIIREAALNELTNIQETNDPHKHIERRIAQLESELMEDK